MASEGIQGWEDFPWLGGEKEKGRVRGPEEGWHRREAGTEVLKRFSSLVPSHRNSVEGVCHPQTVTKFYFQMHMRPSRAFSFVLKIVKVPLFYRR